jgi:hypothetical protein
MEPEVNDQRRREAVAQHVEAHAIESGRVARAEIVRTGSRAIAGVCTGLHGTAAGRSSQSFNGCA